MSALLVIGGAVVVLVVGLLLGRYYVPDTRALRRAAKEGGLYIRGLNHVLAHDNDAAIQELTKAAEHTTRTVDTYFALGVLFRERGEYDRAVRVHQSILVRADANRAMRLRALFQLGLDFESAGFRRRAQKAFEDVLDKDPRHRGAAEKLLFFCEAGGDWTRAHKALARLQKITKEKAPQHEAHLLTEMGLAALEAEDLGAARKLLKQALSRDPESVHALHGFALYQRRSGKVRAAGETWLTALHIAPDLASFLFPHVEEAYFEEEALDALGNRLDALVDKNPDNVHLRLVQARFLGKRSPELAIGVLQTVIEDAPSLLPARRLVGRLVLAEGDEAAIRREFEALLQILDRLGRDYRCARCGHTDNDLFWRCPRCHAWDSVRVAWGRRAGEAAISEPTARPAIPGGPEERRAQPRKSA